jgi:hypothetical protein
MILTEIVWEVVDWIPLDRSIAKRRAVVNTVLNLLVSWNNELCVQLLASQEGLWSMKLLDKCDKTETPLKTYADMTYNTATHRNHYIYRSVITWKCPHFGSVLTHWCALTAADLLPVRLVLATLTPARYQQMRNEAVCLLEKTNDILWHVDRLLGNDREISNYTTDISK